MKKNFARIIFSLLITISILVCPITSYATNFNINFNTTTQSISLLNLDTDTVVFEKNPDEKRSPASTTKIMTYIVTVENINDLENTNITISQDLIDSLSGTESSISGLEAGETFSVYQLLHCLMVSSGNDAALVLADYIGNHDINSFVNMMNNKATELGCVNTHFVNPHGLYDPNHFSTCNDLIKMTKYAMGLPHFNEITNEVVSYVMGDDWPLVTTNKMIDPVNGGSYYYKYAKGIKTGHLDEAGYCLVSSAIKNGYNYLCVALGAPCENTDTNGAMVDSKSLYIWAFDNLEIKTVATKEQPLGEIDLEYAWNKDKLLLTPEKDFSAIVPSNVELSSIEVLTDYPKSVKAPVTAGEKIGTAKLNYANQTIATINLVAMESVDKNIFVYIISLSKKFVTSKWFVISLIIVILLAIAYLTMMAFYNKNKKRQLRRKKHYKRYR